MSFRAEGIDMDGASLEGKGTPQGQVSACRDQSAKHTVGGQQRAVANGSGWQFGGVHFWVMCACMVAAAQLLSRNGMEGARLVGGFVQKSKEAVEALASRGGAARAARG